MPAADLAQLNGSLALRDVRLTPVSLEVPAGFSGEDWRRDFRALRRTKNAVSWWLGDLYRAGERLLGEEASQEIDPDDLDLHTIQNAASVCGRFPISRRREAVSFGHHATVAALEPEIADRLLDVATERKLSVQALREVVREYKHTLNPPRVPKSLPEPEPIQADPDPPREFVAFPEPDPPISSLPEPAELPGQALRPDKALALLLPAEELAAWFTSQGARPLSRSDLGLLRDFARQRIREVGLEFSRRKP